MPDYSSVDNKFKFITIAAARCRQLQRGARPRVEGRSRKAVTIAQEEVLRDLIEYRVPEAVPEEPAAPVAAGESEDAR
jgi:DNA-directed RNA polymerase omega subunit